MARQPDPGNTGHEALWRRQLNAIVETQLARHPFLVQMRAVFRQLRYERESWPILLPVLMALFVIVYWRERRKVLAIARDLAD